MLEKLLHDDLLTGLLALSPFFLLSASLTLGVFVGALVLVNLVLMSLVLFPLRHFISVRQRLVVTLLLSTSVILIVDMLASIWAYELNDRIGLFFPLLMINSLVLSVNENIFSTPDFKSAVSDVFGVGVVVLMFFTLVGFSRSLLEGYSMINSPAACFILTGFLFAVINFFKYRIVR